MRPLILALILALGPIGWTTPLAAQSPEAISGLAAELESSATEVRGLAASTLKAARSILGNPLLMSIVSDEARLIRQTSAVSARALNRLADAHESLAAKLRHEAARRQRNRN